MIMTKPREQVLRQGVTEHLIEISRFYNGNVKMGFDKLAQDELFRTIDVLSRCGVKTWPMYEFGGKNGGLPIIRELRVIWPGQYAPETVYRQWEDKME